MNLLLALSHTARGWVAGFVIVAAGCSSSSHPIPPSGAAAAEGHADAVTGDGAEGAASVATLNGTPIPEQFGFITSRTTLRQVVRQVGRYSRVRGSGMLYYEYDLPDGSAVLVGPEWPFESDSRIRKDFFYPHATDITLAP